MTDRSISAVVFDFGGVLITPITAAISEIAGWHDVAMVTMLDVLMGPREASTSDHPWHRAERGEIPTSTFPTEVAPYAEAAGLTLRGDEYDRLLAGVYDVHHEVIDRVHGLRREGYRTAMLTNCFREFRPQLERDIDMTAFDVVIDSSEVGCRKPEPEVYQVTAERVGVAPEQILYLDDFEANLVGARAAGWRTIHVTDRASILDDIDNALRD